jgi:glycosyltransferase involved in cell wall biosynthesis
MIHSPFRIAFLYDHTLQVGGVESLLLSLIRQARPGEFHFKIFAQTEEPFTSQAADLGAEVIRWSGWRLTDIRTLFALSRQLRRDQVDLVHCQSPIAAIFGRLAAWMAGIPCLVTEHLPMDQYHGTRQTLRARAGRWLYTGLDTTLNYLSPAKLIYVSGRIRDEQVHRRRAPVWKTLVIPSGVDLASFHGLPSRNELRSSLDIPDEDRIIVCVGRLSPEKGQEVLLKAAANLAGQGLDFKLWLVGDGPLREPLEQQIRQGGLENRVRLWGFRQDIPRLLCAADLFVLPSHYEIAPLSILEAMAAGLPVVASAMGEVPLWIKDGCEGRLVTPGDPDQLAGALKDLLTRPEVRSSMSKAAQTRSESFSLAGMAAANFAQYHALVDQTRSGT